MEPFLAGIGGSYGKKLKVLIVFLFVSISFLFEDVSAAYAKEAADISTMLPDGKTEEFYRTQAESVQVHIFY